MAGVNYAHSAQLRETWHLQPWYLQFANIGSEVGRALKYRRMNQDRLAQLAFERSLELFDLSIAAAVDDDRRHHTAHLRELCRAREEWCDCFTGSNFYHSDPARIEKYFMQFASLRPVNRASHSQA